MAFRKLTQAHRKIQLVSLIDLIFILLIFFIISSVMIKLTRAEAKLYIPTPKNEPGEAQILIQIIDQDRYLWIDHSAIDTLNQRSYKLRRPLRQEEKVDLLLRRMAINSEELKRRLTGLRQVALARPNSGYFILIRCPEEKPYFYATNIIEKLVDTPNLEYGCVAGSIDEIRTNSRLEIEGNVIQIDFD